MSSGSLSTWSGMRSKLEKDYLCPALRGHIQYFATKYIKSENYAWRGGIRMDSVEVLRSNTSAYFENVRAKFHELEETFKDCGCGTKPLDMAYAFALDQGNFDLRAFYGAFDIFDSQSIDKSIASENPLVRVFALLDRRLGKRRLRALQETMERELDWVRAFYVIRMQT